MSRTQAHESGASASGPSRYSRRAVRLGAAALASLVALALANPPAHAVPARDSAPAARARVNASAAVSTLRSLGRTSVPGPPVVITETGCCA
jgi:hypothetical protein